LNSYRIPDIRSDIGPDFVALALQEWIATGAKPPTSSPEARGQTGYCENFNAKPRDKLLNSEIFHIERRADHGRSLTAAIQQGASPFVGGMPPARTIIWPTNPVAQTPTLN
jgi:transposase InsO family protein